MKTHKQNLTLFGLTIGIFASSLISCGGNNEKESSYEVLDINVENTKPLSDIFKDCRYIPVAESDTFPGIINVGAIVNDTLFILDPAKAPGVYVYTLDGKLINKFPSIGSGPGEMGMISDMKIDDNYIYLYDFMKFSVETYTHDGKWVCSNSIPGGAAAFMKDDKGIWCDFANQAYGTNNKLIYKPNDNDSINIIHKIPEHLTNVSVVSRITFQRSNGDILYMPNFEPEIYSITDSTKSIAYKLNYNGLWPDNSFFEKLRDMDINERMQVISDEMPIQNIVYHANDNWLMLSFKYNDCNYVCIMNLKTGEQHTYSDKNGDIGGILFLNGNKVYTIEGEDQLGEYTIEM